MTFCLLGENCSVFDRVTKTPGLSLHNPLCEGCHSKAKRELNLLRYDYVDLSQLIPKRDVQSEARIARPKPSSKPPIDMAVFTLRSRIAGVCVGVEVVLRQRLGMLHSGPLPAREGYALTAAIRYLEPRICDVARLPAMAGDFCDEGDDFDGPQIILFFSTLHARARKVCGLEPRTVRVPGFCPSCSVPALQRLDDDEDRLWCSYCSARMSRVEYYAAQRMQFAPVTPDPERR